MFYRSWVEDCILEATDGAAVSALPKWISPPRETSFLHLGKEMEQPN